MVTRTPPVSHSHPLSLYPSLALSCAFRSRHYAESPLIHIQLRRSHGEQRARFLAVHGVPARSRRPETIHVRQTRFGKERELTKQQRAEWGASVLTFIAATCLTPPNSSRFVFKEKLLSLCVSLLCKAAPVFLKVHHQPVGAIERNWYI